MKNLPQWMKELVILGLSLQMMACGTIMYPERRGQKAGKIDVGVAVLDAIGLLFFIIPGVIAFAVDFNNGAIYLPRGGKGLLNFKDLEKVRFDPRANAKADVENILRGKTGYDLNWQDERLRVIKLKNEGEISLYLARAAQEPAGSSPVSSR